MRVDSAGLRSTQDDTGRPPPPQEIIRGTNTSDSTEVLREVEFLNPNSQRLNIIVPASLHGENTSAVLDTASQVTVVSEELYQKLKDPPPKTESVVLKGAAKEGRMRAALLKNVLIELQGNRYSWDVYVAPISDNLLLGLDFMNAHRCVINLKEHTLSIADHQIPFLIHHDFSKNNVCCVKVAQSKVLPPSCVTYILCHMNFPPGSTNTSDDPNCMVIEPLESQHGLSTVPSLVNGTCSFLLPVVNLKSKSAKLKVGEVIGVAEWMDGEVENTPALRQSCIDKEPKHVRPLWEKSSAGLTADESNALRELLYKYEDVFSKDDQDIGCISEVKHRINTAEARPIKQRMRRTPLGFEAEEEKHLKAMLANDIIRPSQSDWASPPVLVRKRDGSVRWCVDYRKLNDVTVKDVFPLPLIEECIDTLRGNEFFSVVDMCSGYWQVEVAEADKPKTAFVTKYGLYEHNRMAFGLCNAPATFQRMIQLVLGDLLWKSALAYLDDVIVVGKEFSEHLDNLEKVLCKFRHYKLKLKPRKCDFFQREVAFLGRVVSVHGIAMDPGKVEKVLQWSVPKNPRELMSFLGFINYHREYLEGFAEKSACLYALASTKTDFQWDNVHQAAFESLKQAMTAAPVLAYPTPDGEFVLDTDASDGAIGAELSQIQDGKLKVIAYGSFALNSCQLNYCTTRKELLAVVRFTRHFRHYLLGRQFFLRTDHNSLTWLMRFKHINGQLARWLEELSQFDMVIVHRAGNKHANADALSRIPDAIPDPSCDCYKAGCQVETLPCKGCRYCRRAQEQWGQFENDVDDVVPLAVRSVSGMSPEAEGSSRTLTAMASQNADTQDWMSRQYSSSDLREQQLQDEDLRCIMEWLESGEEPSQDNIYLKSHITKELWLNRSLLRLSAEGVLIYRRLHHFEVEEFRECLVVPKGLREEVLRMSHDLPLSGHFSHVKTLEKLKQDFFWPQMSTDCMLYVRSCPQCNSQKKPNIHPRGSLGSFHAGTVLERVHLDILGPFPLSQRGNRYVLMVIDQFSKWLECFPLPDQTSESIARVFLEEFIARFGCPLQVHTDQGANFESDLFKSVCSLMETSKTRTTPYHPAGNGQVERMNRTVLQMIRCFLDGTQSTWDQYLAQIAGAVRATPNRTTGFTPNFLMFGREVTSPAACTFGCKPNGSPADPLSYVSLLRDKLHKVHEAARKHIGMAQRYQKRTYDLKLSEKTYAVGDLVYILQSVSKPGQSKKLNPVWKGPAVVSQVLSPVLFRVRTQKRESVIHHNRLKPFQDRTVPIWMKRLRHGLLNLDDDEAVGQDTPVPTDEPADTDPIEDVRFLFPKTTRAGRTVRRPQHLSDYAN